MKNKLLITGTGGCGVGEGIYKSLIHLKKYNIYTCNSSANSLYLFNYPNKSFIVPPANDVNYCKSLINICSKNKINVIIPGSEPELIVLVKNREQFSQLGIIILANSFEVINTFNNKWETFLKLKELGIKTPDTSLDVYDDTFYLKNKFPIIIKPIFGNASKNVFIVNTPEELECVTKYLKLKDISFIIQEYVGTSDEEFTISVLSDFSGKYLGSIILKRLLSGGFSQFVECDNFSKLDKIARKISIDLNSKGPLNIQCRLVNEDLYVFEINPRFSGTTPFRSLLGFNEVDTILSKIFYNQEIFDKSQIKFGYFGVRGFQEKIYNNQLLREFK